MWQSPARHLIRCKAFSELRRSIPIKSYIDQVRSSVRPLIAAFRKTTSRCSDPPIGSRSCSRALSSKICSGFPYADRFDPVPIQVIKARRTAARGRSSRRAGRADYPAPEPAEIRSTRGRERSPRRRRAISPVGRLTKRSCPKLRS